MCTVKELKDYLATIPDGVMVNVMQEYTDDKHYVYAREQELILTDVALVEYYPTHNQLLLGGYA